MVKIGEIYLGGKEGDPKTGIVYNSGIAFKMNKKSPMDGIVELESGKWEVELRKNNQNIIARSRDIFTDDQIVVKGFDSCQKYLDLLAVSQKAILVIQNPGQEYILLFNRDGRMISRILTNGDLGMNLEASIRVFDKDGKEKKSPQELLPDWVPSFRYYRLSQSRTDLYDAYRNLYLAFESLLQEITPINNGERETDWLIRGLNEIKQKINLQHFVPVGKDPIPYITGIYYEHFRCKMFHAKNRNFIIPHEWADAEKLSDAYSGLLRLWRQIAITYKNVQRGGGGITHQGFMVMMDGMAQKGFRMQFTEDPSPANVEDTSVSPQGHRVYSTTENGFLGDYRPGIVLFKGVLENPEEIGIELIHRFGLLFEDTLFSVEIYEDGINPIGIDTLESHETFRLINKSSPKTIF